MMQLPPVCPVLTIHTITAVSDYPQTSFKTNTLVSFSLLQPLSLIHMILPPYYFSEDDLLVITSLVEDFRRGLPRTRGG